jgi:effector-binding domain-containing protein
MGERIQVLSDYAREHGIEPAGPFFVRYHTFGEVETDMETGIPVTQPAEASAGRGQVTAGELPGGPAATTSHFGPHENLGEAYARISDWVKEHGREPEGPAWEVYHWLDFAHPDLQSDPSTWGTQLVQPIK